MAAMFMYHSTRPPPIQVPEASPRRDVAFAGDTALVGSACTLVVEAFLKAEESSSKGGDNTEVQGADDGAANEVGMTGSGNNASPLALMGPALATLLSGVILLDTMNMSPEAGKGTRRDAAALEVLLKRCTVDRTKLFETLQGAKFDPQWWASLSAAQSLAYDYKQAEVTYASSEKSDATAAPTDSLTYGVASVLVSVPDLMAESDFSVACEEFMRQRSLKLLVVMALVTEPAKDDDKGGMSSARRELLLVSKTAEGLEAAVAAIAAPSSEMGQTLGLSPLESTSNAAVSASNIAGSGSNEGKEAAKPAVFARAFAQAALKKSRKQAMPLLHGTLEANQAIAERLS